ncbi:hypothetical protein OG21DRAFT_1366400, partial [Imleria badia]
PQTPTRHDDAPSWLSPKLIHSPSHLTHYLEYAAAHCGVHHALTYKTCLEIEGIGPNVLLKFENRFLCDLGISAGDVVRLKKAIPMWWNAPDANDTVTSDTDGRQASGEQPAKRVAYQKCFHGGGGAQFTGPPMRAEDPGSPLDQDYDLLYFCDAQNQWLPVPYGFI